MVNSVNDAFSKEFIRLSMIDIEGLNHKEIRKTSILYVEKCFYTLSTYLIYTKVHLYFSNPYTLFGFGQIMKFHNRADQIKYLAVEIDLTEHIKYGATWAQFIPNIASVFTGLRTLGVIFLEVHEKWNWYGERVCIDKHPWETAPEEYKRALQNLKASVRGGKFVLYLSGLNYDDYDLVKSELDDMWSSEDHRAWGLAYPPNQKLILRRLVLDAECRKDCIAEENEKGRIQALELQNEEEEWLRKGPHQWTGCCTDYYGVEW